MPLFEPERLKITHLSADTPLNTPVNPIVNQFLTNFEEYALEHLDARLSLDLETTGLDPHTSEITIIGMSYDGEHVLLVHPKHLPVGRFNRVMADPRLRKVMHNSKFDTKHLAVHFGTEFANVECSYVMKRLLVTGLDKSSSLAACAFEYLDGYVMSKEVRSQFIGTTEVTTDMAKYAAIDVAATWTIYPHIRAHIAREGLTELYEYIEKPLAVIVGEMEAEGVDVDLDYLKRLQDMLEPKIQNYQKELDSILAEYGALPTKSRDELKREKLARGVVKGSAEYEAKTKVVEELDSINVNTPAQVVQVLNLLGFHLKSSAKEVLEAPSYTQASMREAMVRMQKTEDEVLAIGYDVIERILDLRAARKAVSGFVIPLSTVKHKVGVNKDGYDEFEGHINPKTGKIHTNLNQLGTNTGRFSNDDPNFQQMPSVRKASIFEGLEFRQAFVAPEGWDMIIYDYQAAEPRILAQVTRDPGLIQSMHHKDPHIANAAIMFNVPVEEINKEDPRRQMGKTGILTYVYGGGPKRIAAVLKCSIGRAKEIVALMQDAFPGIPRFASACHNTALNQGFVMSLSGRKRYFELPEKPEFKSGFQYEMDIKKYNGMRASIERKSQNAPIQMTSADIMKLAMVWVDEAFKKMGPKGNRPQLLLTIHDELVAKAPKHLTEQANAAMRDAMVRASAEFLDKVPSVIDGTISNYWQK